MGRDRIADAKLQCLEDTFPHHLQMDRHTSSSVHMLDENDDYRRPEAPFH